jgi:hypothetical protein
MDREMTRRERDGRWDVTVPIHVSAFRKPRIMRKINENEERPLNEGGDKS